MYILHKILPPKQSAQKYFKIWYPRFHSQANKCHPELSNTLCIYGLCLKGTPWSWCYHLGASSRPGKSRKRRERSLQTFVPAKTPGNKVNTSIFSQNSGHFWKFLTLWKSCFSLLWYIVNKLQKKTHIPVVCVCYVRWLFSVKYSLLLWLVTI